MNFESSDLAEYIDYFGEENAAVIEERYLLLLTLSEPHDTATLSRKSELLPWDIPLKLDPSDSHEGSAGDILQKGYTFDTRKFTVEDYEKVNPLLDWKVSQAMKRAAIRAGLQTFSQGKKNPKDRNSSVRHYCSHKKRNYSNESKAVYEVYDTPHDDSHNLYILFDTQACHY